MSEQTNPPTFTTDDILRAMGTELRRVRMNTAWVALAAVVQLVLIALWLFGVITVELTEGGL